MLSWLPLDVENIAMLFCQIAKNSTIVELRLEVPWVMLGTITAFSANYVARLQLTAKLVICPACHSSNYIPVNTWPRDLRKFLAFRVITTSPRISELPCFCQLTARPRIICYRWLIANKSESDKRKGVTSACLVAGRVRKWRDTDSPGRFTDRARASAADGRRHRGIHHHIHHPHHHCWHECS